MSETFCLRWGIIGCGLISNDFVRALSYCEHSHQVAAVATSNSVERAKKFCDSLSLAKSTKVYGSYEELFADTNVDIVYIGNLNDAHCEWTLKALDAGKPVLCEKPMGVNAAQVRQMVEKAREKKLFLMEAYWSRFFPTWRKLREILDSKKYGEVKLCSVNFGAQLREAFFDTSKGITPLLDIGGYTLQLALFVFGTKNPHRIHAVGEKNAKGCDLWSNVTLDYGDGTQALCYTNGTISAANSAFICFEKGQVQLPEFFWNATRLVEVEGGQIEISDTLDTNAAPASSAALKSRIHEFPLNDKKDASNFVYAHSSGLRYEADHVFECLRQGKLESDVMSLDESIRLHELITEIRRQIGVVFPQDSHATSTAK